LVTFDIEATGLNGDYNSVICVSLKPYGKKPYTFKIDKPGGDRSVVRAAKEALEAADCWVGYYSKMFDIRMLNTRLLRYGIKPIEKRPHIDMYFVLSSAVNTSRRSQGHYLSWLEVDDDDTAAGHTAAGKPLRKMGVSADVWAKLVGNLGKYLPTMVRRCESDVCGLEGLLKRTEHLVQEITR
jgi:hypothetical protein